MIDLTLHKEQLESAVKRARERNIIIPTFAQQKDPSLIPIRLRKSFPRSGSGTLLPATFSVLPGKMNL